MNNLDNRLLAELLNRYREAPEFFHATPFWEYFENKISKEIAKLDLKKIDSGIYPYLGIFGFGTVPYRKQFRSTRSFNPRRFASNLVLDILEHFISTRKSSSFLPYSMRMEDIYKLAFDKAELTALKSGAKHPKTIEAPVFGEPQDIFQIDGRNYSISYLNYFTRYCFAQSIINFRGDEIFVEIGSGSAKQVAVLKQALPNATFLCFDLPLQLFLGYNYINKIFSSSVVDLNLTKDWSDLSRLERGKIYFFGNWQIPIVRELNFDVFWNAASFGEMEPKIVKRYLSYVTDNAAWIYLMQAKLGQETGPGRGGVIEPQTFSDYCGYLQNYSLKQEQLAQGILKPWREVGGYFEAVWERSNHSLIRPYQPF